MKRTDTQLLQALQLQEQGKPAEAAQLFRQILQRTPQDGAALYSLALLELNHFKDRDTALRLTEAGVAAVPHYAPMHALRALALHEAGELQAALDSYAQALKIDPHYVTALINSSVLQQQLAQHHAALDSLQRVLAIEPDNALALANCGTLLTEFKRGEEAIALFERLLQVAPGYDFGLGMLCFEKLHICDWQGIEALRERIVAGIRAGQPTSKTFPLLAICDEPRTLHAAARLFTERSYPAARQPLWRGEQYRHERIRIAYVSADLREHPVGHLLAGVIERHDKQRFETIGISLGIDDQSSLRARFIAAFDQFHDVQKLGSPKIAQLIRDLEVDILINLSGYTSGSRSEIFAQRPAPIQVNYLGYPGTLGADYIDYILADRHVTPLDEQDCYSEKIVQLPHSYLPTDGQLKVAERTPTRAEFGLPDSGLVFCSFNHDYKISPEVFAVWMRLLQRVEGSVLWLMKLNEPAQRNLCRAAEEHGIDPQRLIFATRVPRVEDHLARYRLADLFLDCYPYNAHTTAADALFVGLPVLTYMGKVFQGRVAGSLLSTLDMPELITHSLEEYEAQAYHLATTPAALAQLHAKLAEKRTSTPLYDTELFCRHVEAAYLEMWQRWQGGRLPEPFMVRDAHQPLPAGSLAESAERTGAAPGQPRRLHIGGKVRAAGWEVLNAIPDVCVDHVGNANNLRQFADNTFVELYASHVVEHFDYMNELQATLNEWFRVLQSGGKIHVSVPDLDVLCQLMLAKEQLNMLERFMVMRMMFGGHVDRYDYHTVGLNEEFLRHFLTQAGFVNIRRVEEFGLFEDTSSLQFRGIRISLNLTAEKP